MKFTTLITELSEQINLDIDDTTNLANIKRWLNMAYKDANKYDWHWLISKGRFQTVEVYDTGTVTVTEGSRSVTGSGTTWTTAMEGRYFRVEGTYDWYKIIDVASATALTIDMPYLEDSGASKQYKIWKRYYEVNSDVQFLTGQYLDVYPFRVKIISSLEFPEIQLNQYLQGNPSVCRLIEYDKSIRTYTTGTVSGTIDTKTVTGSSTVWLDNVIPGDKITIGSYDYYVLSIDSDTQITLTGNLMATVAAGTSYTATRQDTQALEFDAIPKDPARNVTYTYRKRVYDMQNDNDLPEMPDDFQELIILCAKRIAFNALDDTREAQASVIYENKLLQIKREITNSVDVPDSWSWYDNRGEA